MALYNWLVQSCCNPSITKVVKYTPILFTGIIFQDSLGNCYQVVTSTADTPNIFLTDFVPLYKTCEDCLIDLPPCDPPKEPTTVWLVQSCCDKAITQIVVNNNIVPGDIFQDSLGDCYTVLIVTEGDPTIVIIDETVYKICEDCITCPPPEPSVTPSITQSPFPTQTVTPTITVTPSSTTYPLISKTPSATPTATISITPSPTVSPGSPICDCITYINTSVFSSYQSFYTTCNGFVGAQFTIAPQQTIQVCGSNPSAGNPAVTFYTGSACIEEECVTPDISPTPTPTPSATSVSGSDVVIDDLCMDIVFGPAPTPSTTPTATVSTTPSVTVSTSTFPIFPSISPSVTLSITPSITPSVTPTISVSTTPSTTPSVTPTRTATPTISVTKTPTVSITPTKTPTPTPTQSGGAIVVPECSVIYNGPGANQVYAYNSTTNVSTLLNLGTSPLQVGSSDIAHTATKLWLYASLNGTTTTIFEYDITLSPFTSVYNRVINVPVGIALGAGICAIDNTTLLSSDQFSNDRIIKITLNPSPNNTTIIENLFTLPSGRIISGDLLYTTDRKIIVTTQTRNAPYSYWISQYTLEGTLEFDLPITSTAPFPYGLATINGGIYIFSGNNLKQISTTYPYTITQVNNIGNSLAGASQVPSCCNVSFQPNIIGASPSLTPTPTKTITPTKTPTPSTTPFPTRTPTPTPSPTSNSTPCQGTLPMPGGSTTINGVTMVASGTGCLRLSTSAYASCNTTTPTNTIWAGSNPYCPNSSAFSYTLTFSQPVNNISLPITAIGNGVGENISFTTNVGTPTILSNNSCGCIIVGNQIQSTATLNGGGGLFTISAPSSFTTLTISGQGGQNGSFIGIDCTSIIPAPTADCVSCNILALPPSGVGTITNGNLTVNTTYSGPQLPPTQLSNSTCTGLTMPANPMTLGANIGAFIYTLNFSQPVNNIKFLISAGGVTSNPTLLETFTFNTSGGTPTLSACGQSCGTTINNNVLQLGLVLPYGGGVLTQVKATNPYTQIIITGNGGAAGSTIAICLDTATPLPSSSPSVTPSITKSLSVTPSKTATPSKTPSTTPSITPTKTTTPSITPSTSPGFAANCNNILYKTQTSQYYSYNFANSTSTLLNVPAPPYVGGGRAENNLANTSNKLWSYTYYPNGGNLSSYSIIEYNITNTPFSATINRYIALPKILNYDITSGNGLFALNNTKLVGTINEIFVANLYGTVTEQDIINNPLNQYANGVMVVEYDITSNAATWTLKAKLLPNEIVYSGLLVTTNNKLLVVTQQLTFNGNGTHSQFINQFNYNTGVLEFRKEITPIITTQCGLSEVNGNVYLMGYNVYKIDTIAPYNLTLVQTTGNQLVASSQLASCIDTNFPISNCPECLALPLKLVTPMTYNGITIIPSYTGPTASDNTNPGSWSSCSGSLVSTQPPFSAFLGNIAGDYTYNLTFSQPVNNIKIQYNGTNSNPNPYELFTWNTSGGTPTINLCKGCYQTINNNTISASWSGVPDYIGGGGIITITAPLNYTTLTLTSPGGNQGTIFSICSSSIVPAPVVSPSLSPTPSKTPTPTPSTSPPSTGLLGCVYYSSNNNTYNYNPSTNISTQVTLPTDTFTSFAETHISTKYWKGNQTSTIKEWIPTNNPTTLALNRTITVSGITSMFGNYFIFLQAIDDNTLLTTIANSQVTPAGDYINSLVRLDITNNTITTAQMTTMFDIYSPAGLDSILLTSTNKLITVGKRNTPSAQNVTYLSQYSYPGGVLEADIDISSTVLATNGQRYLFESNGNLFVSIQFPDPTSTIYSINLNSPYTLTPVYTNMNLLGATFNSSINCNTVNLTVPPQPSPTPSPSPSAPSNAFRTIYKYLDIQ